MLVDLILDAGHLFHVLRQSEIAIIVAVNLAQYVM